MAITKEYLKSRKEMLYFLGGAGIGAYLGPKGFLGIALIFGVLILIYNRWKSERRDQTKL